MAIEINSETLAKINKFTRRELSADEVYCFNVILCDNEIDRDNEKFSKEALKKLAELYVGKTGIFNHDPKGENQTARIFDASVIEDPSRKTTDGETYAYLSAKAYMVKTDKNADLIKEIDAGIKKEVSVGCSVAGRVCSVCKKDSANGMCAHKKGRSYAGKKCYHILNNPTDAYEWSFVAVPAQRNAGVTKRFGEGEAVSKAHSSQAELLEMLTEELKKDILRLSFLEGDTIPVSLTKAAIERMDTYELIELKKALSSEAFKPAESELEAAVASRTELNENASFKL
ncbi:MAG: hypothetical protein IJ424_07420 [Oscillospiraceae bacterium]|nr:hypothetical protein [Oscillospiraceae bacterium]